MSDEWIDIDEEPDEPLDWFYAAAIALLATGFVVLAAMLVCGVKL